MRLGITLAGKSPVAVQSTKALVNYSVGRSVQEGVFSSSFSFHPRKCTVLTLDQACCIPNHGTRPPCRHRTFPTRLRQLCNGRNPPSRNCRPGLVVHGRLFFLYEAAGEAEFVSASERAESFYVLFLFYVVWIMVRGLWFIYITIQPWSVTLRSYLLRSVTVKTTSESPVIGRVFMGYHSVMDPSFQPK